MRVYFLVCLAAGLLAGCGSGSSKRPPDEFLEAHWSFGDVDDTSTCFRVQQLVFQLTDIDGSHEWTRIDASTWEYTQQFSAHGKEATSRLRLQQHGEMVRMLEYEEIIGGAEYTRSTAGTIKGYANSFFQVMRAGGLLFIKGCKDPSYTAGTRRYEVEEEEAAEETEDTEETVQ